MTEVAVPPQSSAAVPPMVETVTPGVGSFPVAKVELQYPPRFQEIVTDIGQADSPASRLRLASNISAQTEETKAYHPNEQPQWGKVLVSVLSRQYGEALKWYNGGAVVEDDAKDVNNNLYFKERNERGFTGRIKDSNGRLLSPKQMEELNARGGIFTDNDTKVLRTAPWQNGVNNAVLAANGLRSQFQLATNDAYNAARVAGGANKNLDEQIAITKNIKNVVDYVGSLPSEQRQKLLGFINRYNTISANRSNENARAVGANANELKSQTSGAGGNVGIGAPGSEGGIPPAGGKGAIGGNLSVSNTAQTNIGASAREANTAGSTAGSSLQEQQNLQAAIMQAMQGVIKTPEEFQQFARLQSLNAQNDADYKNIPDHVKPKGWENIPETDVYTGGSQAILANRVQQQRNNALMAAWSAELFKAQREAAQTGKSFDVDSLSDKFAKSDLYKAINNTYAHQLRYHVTGERTVPAAGELFVDKSNRIHVSK